MRIFSITPGGQRRTISYSLIGTMGSTSLSAAAGAARDAPAAGSRFFCFACESFQWQTTRDDVY